MQWESIQGRDGNTNKVVGDGDAFGSCVFQQPVELGLTPREGACNSWGGSYHPFEGHK